MGKIDLTEVLAEFDISFMKLQSTIVLLNMVLSTSKFCSDYSVTKYRIAQNSDLSNYYKRLVEIGKMNGNSNSYVI